MPEIEDDFFSKRHEVPNIEALPPIVIKAEELPPLPFTAIVGQAHMKKAVLLGLSNPSIRGVLLVGDREVGKGTAIQSGAALLPPGTPFVEMPLNVTKVQLFGGKVKGVLGEIEKEGLVSRASGGYLFIERINLFDDGTLEKIITYSEKKKYTLLATANAEDGPLPKEFEDKLDLRVEVESLADIEERIEILKRLEGYRKDPKAFYHVYSSQEQNLAGKIARARKLAPTIEPSKETQKEIARICKKRKQEEKCDSLLKAAAANASLENRTWTGKEDVAEVASLVLG